jgi:iron complex outermembrane receptor protein
MRILLLIIPLVLIRLLIASKCHAEESSEPNLDIPSLEQLMETEVTTVTGASKYQQELIDAPASVSIISFDDIRKGGFRNLAEILNSVGGFYTSYVRSFHNMGVRGFSPLGDVNNRLLLMVDGHRLNDALYESAPMGTDFPVDLDLIDRIEVIRGPGSSLYGTSAFLAVVNVITRSGKDLQGGELSTSGGSFNSWTGRATGGGRLSGGVDLLVSGSYRDSAGKQRLFFPEYTATNNGIAQGLDGEKSWDLFAKAAWKDFSLLLIHQTRDKNVPTAHYGSIFNDPGAMVGDRHTLIGLNYSHSASWADINARLTYNRYGAISDYPTSDAFGARVLNRDQNVGEWIGSDLFVTKSISDHLLTVGMEHRWQFTEHLQNFDVSPHSQWIDLNKHSLIQGYYIQDEYHILKQLILNAGLRVDCYDNFGSTINPRAALIWKPQDSTVLRLSYGEAFRSPNAYELYAGDGTTQKGNTSLRPEKVHTVELGWDQYLGENIRTTATGFYTHISDLLEQTTDTDGLLVFRNQSEIESKGAELQVEGKWENGFSGRMNYSYQSSSYIGSSQPVVNSPRTMLKGTLTAPLPLHKSFATLEGIYSSSRLNVNQEKVKGAAIFNLTLLNRDLMKGLDLSASVYNLFDTRYSVPSGPEHFNNLGETLREIEQDGIAFRIKATYRF